MKGVLQQYERCYGQLINLEKSIFYVHEKTDKKWV